MNDEDQIIYECKGLTEIRESPDILEKLKLDITPQKVMEPRYQSNPEDLKKLAEVSGYVFYIESEQVEYLFL